MTQVEAADLDELENHKSFVVKLKYDDPQPYHALIRQRHQGKM